MTQPQLEPDGLRMFSLLSKTFSYIEAAAFDEMIELPKKRYITTGQTAHDVEQVAVTAISLTTGLPAANMPTIPRAQECGPTWSMSMELSIIRCGPQLGRSGVITDEKMTEAARMSSGDVGIIMAVIDRLRKDQYTVSDIAVSITPGTYEGQLIPTVARVTVALP